MAMRKSTAQELKMLREFAHDIMPQMKCYFCRKPLMDADPGFKFGDRKASPVPVKITGHHKNHDHSDNRQSNRSWAHTLCHKRYHASLGGWRSHEVKTKKAAA